MVRKWVWFNPINPPINALILARSAIKYIDVFISTNDKIVNGASFCHVDNSNAGIQAIDVITDGYHRWHGTMPILISRENMRTVFIK